MTSRTIVFDLDGTLVDTAPDLLDSLNHSLLVGGVANIDAAALKSYVGLGGKILIQRAFAAQGRQLEPEEHDRLLTVFLDHYTAGIPGASMPYPGVAVALQRFADAGFVMAVCTNKFEMMSRRLLAGVGLLQYFSAVCGQDTFSFRKPDPRHLTETILRAGGDPGTAVMVGDSQTDIDTAKAAGIPVVAVDFGYTDRHVREFEPSRIISHFDELTVAMAGQLIEAAQ